MVENNSFLDKVLNNFINFIYSPSKKYERILIFLVIIGFILRLAAALNLDVLADDMVYASQSAGILDAKVLSTHSNPPLFFYLTDIAYQIFGYTTFASRFWPLIYGTMLIIIVFLIGKFFFDEKTGLAAAFFATFSNFLVRMTFTEAALIVFFFCFLGAYFGLIYLKKRELKWLVLSGVVFGLGLLTKYNTPFFIMSFLVYSAYFIKSKKEIVFSKNNIKNLFIFISILFLFALPFLSFNYLLYKDKGIVDVYFSRIINLEKTQELYGGLAGQGNSFFDNLLNIKNYGNYSLLYHTDIVILIFSLFGIFLWIKDKRKHELVFFIIFLVIPFVLQSAGSPLQKHFSFMIILFSLPAGYSINFIFEKISSWKMIFLIAILLSAFLIYNLNIAYGTPQNYFSKSPTSQLKSWINSNVEENSLIVFDSRIYPARSIWAATPKNFLLLDQFFSFYEINQNISSEKIPTKIHIVECAIDDCGLGWVKDNSEFNISSENVLNVLKNNSNLEEIIYLKQKNEGKEEIYRLYNINIPIHPSLLEQTKLIQQFYFTPYLYKNMNNYIFSLSDKNIIIKDLSLLIIYLSIFLTFIFLVYSSLIIITKPFGFSTPH